MVPPVFNLQTLARHSTDALTWDLQGLRGYRQGESLVLDIAARLPFFVPRAGVLLLDWQAVPTDQDCLRVRPRLDLHAEPWLDIPAVTVRPTGALVQVEEQGAERQWFLQMPRRAGRSTARLPLSTGLMRMSMQAHDEHARFLPLVLRSDLSEDRHGQASLHLHSLDLKELVLRRAIEPERARVLAGNLAERVLGLMSLAGAGLARESPMIVSIDD
jgi:hypothetical protein